MSFFLALILGTSAHALAFTTTVQGAPPAIPCAVYNDGEKLWVFTDSKKIARAGQEVVIEWIPPFDKECVVSEFVARTASFRTWQHTGMAPCVGRWVCRVAVRSKLDKDDIVYLLETTFEPEVKKK